MSPCYLSDWGRSNRTHLSIRSRCVCSSTIFTLYNTSLSNGGSYVYTSSRNVILTLGQVRECHQRLTTRSNLSPDVALLLFLFLLNSRSVVYKHSTVNNRCNGLESHSEKYFFQFSSDSDTQIQVKLLFFSPLLFRLFISTAHLLDF